ncbi:MAG: hypothetical protein CBB71_11770 [Rhodopirellula sp. TMED11]|nr:MAG: hypothetical protein CBB71_11770 [Rhodopirellula sp. TMED11]
MNRFIKLFALLFVFAVVGCGSEQSTVLDQAVEVDPSLDASATDPAQYEAMQNADPTPPE